MSDIDHCSSIIIIIGHKSYCLADFTVGTVRLTKEAETVTKLINCNSTSSNSEAENFLDCLLPGFLLIESRNQVAGLICGTFLLPSHNLISACHFYRLH